MREHEFQQIQSEVESRERGAENLDAEAGDAVIYDGETWLLTMVVEGPRGPVAHLENWNRQKRVNPAFLEAKN